MKNLRTFRLATLAIVALLAGCASAPKSADVNDPSEPQKPSEILMTVFRSIQMQETAGIERFFSRRIPVSFVKQFIRESMEQKQLVEFHVVKGGEQISDAWVDLSVTFRPVAERRNGLILRTDPERTVKERFLFAKEGKRWRIRVLGDPKLDARVEQSLFFQCLNAVMDTRIAQEQYRGRRPRYASNIGALQTTVPIRIDACRELRIDRADPKDYRITAVTLNSVSCVISATTEGFMPARWQECPGQPKALLAAVKEPIKKKKIAKKPAKKPAAKKPVPAAKAVQP